MHNGADAKATTNLGYTAFHLAVIGGQLDIVEMFLKDGFDVNVKSDNEETPVFVARQFGHRNIAELLLEHRADVWVRDMK